MRIRVIILLVVAGLFWMGTVRSVQATFGLRLYFDSPSNTINMGGVKTLRLMADSGNIYLSGVDFTLNFNSAIKVNKITMNGSNFSVIQKAVIEGDQLIFIGYNLNKFTNQLPKGVFEIGTIEIQGLSNGSGNILMTSSQAVGNDGVAPLYFSVNYEKPTITVGDGSVPSVTPIPTLPPVGTVPILNFKMSFSGVESEAECTNWSVQVMIIATDGSTKTYNDVGLVKTNETKNGLAVYRSSMALYGFGQTNNLAIFIKGPKHLQMKYAVNNQAGNYGKAGGEIKLTKNVSTSTWYDFSGYPILPGDVTGPVAGKQDGLVDGRDFAFAKGQISKMTRVNPGGDIVSDFNGNCQLETQDSSLLMNSLSERQGEIY